MIHMDTEAQPKDVRFTMRLTREERRLIDRLAYVRGESTAEIIRQHGVEEAVQLGRRIDQRLSD